MPLHFVKPGTLIRFLNYRKFAYLFSGTLFLISIISFFFGINFGIDFLGGIIKAFIILLLIALIIQFLGTTCS